MNKLTRILGLGLLLGGLAYSAQAQPENYPTRCKHNRITFYEDARILEIRVKDFSPKTGLIDYIFEAHDLIQFGVFQLTKQSWVGNAVEPGNIYMVVYCSNEKHGSGANNRNKHIIYIDKVSDEQLKEQLKRDPLDREGG